jgi:hypothetical protein
MKTLLFLDWDDTLLPTHYLKNLKNYKLSEESTISESDKKLLINHTQILDELLSSFMIGDTKIIIITNSEKFWVELSIERFLPKFSLSKYNIDVISSRSHYEFIYPNDNIKWKYLAFDKEITNFVFEIELSKEESNEVNEINIISIGDSEFERKAIRLAVENFNNNYSSSLLNIAKYKIYSKSLKLLETPTIEYLQEQLKFLMVKYYDYIYYKKKDLDLKINVVNN